MNKKKHIYLLLPVAALLWILIIYKVINAVKDTNEPVATSEWQIPQYDQSSAASDTFSLRLGYADPFLKSRRVAPKPQTNTNRTIKAPKTKPKRAVRFPAVQYDGMFKSGSRKTALLKINQLEFILAPGEQDQGVKVVQIWADSVRLKFQSVERVFYK